MHAVCSGVGEMRTCRQHGSARATDNGAVLQASVSDMFNKSAVEHCPEDGNCLPFLQRVHTLEKQASGIAQQLLRQECRRVAGYPDDMHGQEDSVYRNNSHVGGALTDSHTASIEVGRSACCCPPLCAAIACRRIATYCSSWA